MSEPACSVDDVAAYILQKTGPMSAMKLQKLVYYSQAWSLVWDERPLFPERIEAWANGPVVRHLYDKHRGVFELSSWIGRPENLDQDARETVDSVVQHYGPMKAQWLSHLTHQEHPWRDARHGLREGERGSSEITQAALMEYYHGLHSHGEEG